jgi:hypothetical protein
MQPMPWMAANVDDLTAYLGAAAMDRDAMKGNRHED